MKKTFFTTVAMFAFAGLSIVNAKTFIELNCPAVFNATYIYARNQGLSDASANIIAFKAYDECMGCNTIVKPTKNIN
jgi:hypothetical protein